MQPYLVAIQGVGVVAVLTGVVCMAALPLEGYRWYNRVAVVVLMGAAGCWTLIAQPLVPLFLGPVNSADLGFGCLCYGVPLLAIVCFSLRRVPAITPPTTPRLLARGVWCMPAGMAVLLIPSMLALAGVPPR